MKEKIRSVNKLYLAVVLTILVGATVLFSILGLVLGILGAYGFDYEKAINQITYTLENNQVVAMIVSQSLILLPIIIFSLNKKKLVKEVIRFNPLSVKTVVGLIVLTYTIIPVMSFINILSMMFVKNEIANTIDNIVGNQNIVVAVLVVAGLPAFIEEILCRGIIYNTHVKVSVRRAILFSGILFGCLHCNFNQFAYAFFMGVVFAMVVEATDSIFSTIFMHFIINANSIVIAYISKIMDKNVEVDTKTTYTWSEVCSWGVLALIALFVSICVFREIAMKAGRWEIIKSTLGIKSRKKKKSNNKIDKKSDEKLEKDDEIVEDIKDEKSEEINEMLQDVTDSKLKEKTKIADIYLFTALLICVIYMVVVEML